MEIQSSDVRLGRPAEIQFAVFVIVSPSFENTVSELHQGVVFAFVLSFVPTVFVKAWLKDEDAFWIYAFCSCKWRSPWVGGAGVCENLFVRIDDPERVVPFIDSGVFGADAKG